MRLIYAVFAALLISLGLNGPAIACEPRYTVQEGDTLFSIAKTTLGDVSKWSEIFYANPVLEGDGMLKVPTGEVLIIPCVGGNVGTPAQAGDVEMKILTGGDYAPFTARDWPEQGMLSELVNAALGETPDPVSFSISWEDDWSQHLFPLIDSKTYDMGFPWMRPDCENDRTDERCVNFHFSDPLVDVVISVFTRASDPIAFEQDSDLHGRTLCRPVGYFTHDLDRSDRQWLTKGLVTLTQPATPEACFSLLMAGQVDAVVVNEFLGVMTASEMGLIDQVTPLPRPLSTQGLHVVISKKHWRGTTHLYRINAGLARLKQDGRYSEIVSRHLAIFWDRVQG